MIIVTNRNLQPRKSATQRFGKDFNAEGPDELRLATATRSATGKWSVKILPDGSRRGNRRVPTSEVVFLDLQKRMRTQKRDALVFVHGFNNDFRSVLQRGWKIERDYGVEVICFSWPADGNGGRGKLRGTLGGTLAYKNDKNDAVRSVPAFNRTLQKLSGYLGQYRDERCDGRVTLLLHSMGNYLFKNLLKSAIYEGETEIFDNIVMCAADVNNEGHEEWVDRVQYRRRLYITINENDVALAASRLKFGAQQRARLGHFPRNLHSRKALYVDFTQGAHVENAHAYFEGNPARRNHHVRHFFRAALGGQRAEDGLVEVQPSLYRVP